MAKAGRALEQLVETLESLLAGSGVNVRSPDVLTDKVTGEPREVDVSLRSRVGSAHILVIMECRDRGRAQDVLWIEQLATKRDDVGANMAIAVSRNGFSAAARSKAQFKGIELRTLGEVDKISLSGWLGVKFMTVTIRQRHIHNVKLYYVAESTSPEMMDAVSNFLAEPIATDVPFLRFMSDGRLLSIDELMRECPTPDEVDYLPAGERKRGTVHLAPPDSSPWISLALQGGDVELSEIEADTEFWLERQNIPVIQYEYRDTDELLLDGVHAEFDHGGFPVRAGIHSTPDGAKYMSLVHPEGIGTAWEANIEFAILEQEVAPPD